MKFVALYLFTVSFTTVWLKPRYDKPGVSMGLDTRLDLCEKSKLISVESCTASHNGTECINLYKNGKYSFGAGGVEGQKYCTKGLEVYNP